MGNLLKFVAAMFLLALLYAAQYYPASPLFWVASMTTTFTVLRYTLVVVLFLFIIHPPKAKWLRIPLGLSTLALAIWLADTTYQGSLGFIDFLTLAIATVALFTCLLESKPKDEEFKSIRFLIALFGWVMDSVRVASSWGLQFGWLLITDLGILLDSYSETAAKEMGLAQERRRGHGHA